MGCGASKNPPNNSASLHIVHWLVTETASPSTKIKAYNAIKNDDVFLVEKILQEIPVTENLGLSGENATCLHVAAQQNSFHAMKALISWLKTNKADEIQQIMEITNSDGNTPVTLCIKKDAGETFYVMINENVVRRDYLTETGETLSDLCHHHSFNCLELLEGRQEQNQPNQQKEIINNNDKNNNRPVDPEKEHREKKVDTIIAKVDKVHAQKNEELDNVRDTKKPPALKGVPTDSEVYRIINMAIQQGDFDLEFLDPDFPHTVDSFTTDFSHEDYGKFKTAVWKRPHELFDCDYDQIKVFDTIDVGDIEQGLLGDCYYLSSLSALTEFPSRLTKMFLTKRMNKYGVYGLQFYVRGVPTEVIIDDYFPCDEDGDPLFAKPKGRELWVLLAEKAWAKLFNNYIACDGGTAAEALEHMLGSPVIYYSTEKQEAHEIFKILSEGDNAKHVLCAGSNKNVSKEDTGLVGGHAYSVISVHNVGKYRLLKLRNPWGKFEWKGDFGDASNLWTDQLKAKVGYTNADDGVFCMTVDDFKKNFTSYSVCIYNEGWEYTYCEAESDPNHAEYFMFTIDQPCVAYFRIHQDNKRKLNEEEQKKHKYAGGDLIVARDENDGTYIPVLADGSDIDSSCTFGDRSIFPSNQYKLELKTP